MVINRFTVVAWGFGEPFGVFLYEKLVSRAIKIDDFLLTSAILVLYSMNSKLAQRFRRLSTRSLEFSGIFSKIADTRDSTA